MRDFSLRLPYLIYLAIGSLFLGVLIAPIFRDVPDNPVPAAASQSMEMSQEMHTMREVEPENAPKLSMIISKDPMQGWNLVLQTQDFEFSPEEAGKDFVPNTGHAHLYINGMKTARIYSHYYHFPDLPPGQHTVTVSLSGNDHSYYMVNNARIETEAVIMQSDEPIMGN